MTEPLLRALKRAGFVTVGSGRAHVRFAWPGTNGDPGNEATLLVPTDPTAPEYDELRAAVLRQLENARTRGEAAERVLETNLRDREDC